MTNGGRFIGNSLREAVDWAQETLRTTRPIAEQTIHSAIAAKKAIWDGATVSLLEDDEDLEKRKIASVQTTQHQYNAAKKWSRIHFRNQNRKTSRGGKNSLSSIHKQAASKFSNAAEDMITSSIAGLPSGSNVEENDNS